MMTRWLGAAVASALLGLATGCSAASSVASTGSPSGGAASGGAASAGATPAGTACGTTQTGAGVDVVVKVAKGTVSCATAMAVEEQYAAMIRAGDLRGNGGGAPLSVSGWTCQGYPTPQVLATGTTSQCHTGSAEVIAVLAVPASPPASASASAAASAG